MSSLKTQITINIIHLVFIKHYVAEMNQLIVQYQNLLRLLNTYLILRNLCEIFNIAFMARIVYKEGLEGQNRLECIEGIEIELLNGQKALIYPKYAVRQMLSSEQIDKWDAKELTEIRALKVENTAKDTRELLSIGSPAAEWVNQFQFGCTRFCLPSLLAAMEIQY